MTPGRGPAKGNRSWGREGPPGRWARKPVAEEGEFPLPRGPSRGCCASGDVVCASRHAASVSVHSRGQIGVLVVDADAVMVETAENEGVDRLPADGIDCPLSLRIGTAIGTRRARDCDNSAVCNTMDDLMEGVWFWSVDTGDTLLGVVQVVDFRQMHFAALFVPRADKVARKRGCVLAVAMAWLPCGRFIADLGDPSLAGRPASPRLCWWQTGPGDRLSRSALTQGDNGAASSLLTLPTSASNSRQAFQTTAQSC